MKRPTTLEDLVSDKMIDEIVNATEVMMRSDGTVFVKGAPAAPCLLEMLKHKSLAYEEMMIGIHEHSLTYFSKHHSYQTAA